jgi:ABC-type nitrate/sulfonate/bicarbonate transport system substrate-binding protein
VEPAGAARVRRAAFALLACLALAGCGSRDETTTPKSFTATRVVVPQGASSAGLIAASDRAGLFRQAGLATKVQTGSTGLDAVAQGRAELAVASQPAVLQARNRGLRVVSVAALVHGPRVVVVSTSAVSSPRDLAGKRLGVFGGPFERAVAKTLSARAGGGGIRVAPVGNPSKTLEKHQVDAVLGPAGAVHVKKAKAVTIDRLGIPTYDEEVLVAPEDGVKGNGDDVRAFIGALWHQAQGKAPGPQSPAQWARFAEWMEANGLLKGQPSASEAVTNDLLPGLHG